MSEIRIAKIETRLSELTWLVRAIVAAQILGLLQ